MAKQPASTSAPATNENPMLDLIKILAISDPHHMVEAMQKLFPFAAAIPGLDVARLTEFQEKNVAAIVEASTTVQKIVRDTAAEECHMLQECVSETLRSLQQMSHAGERPGAGAKQTDMVVQIMDKLSKETIELMESNSEQMIAVLKDMRLRYVDALNEIKQMSQQSNT